MDIDLSAPFTLDSWDVTADPAPADPAPADAGAPVTGLAVLTKTYAGGDLTGTATGHALTTQGPGGAAYVAQERIAGTIAGRTGSFVLGHGASGGPGHEDVMRAAIVPGSGTGGLAGISGSGRLEHGLLTLRVVLAD